jgi:hypothetical protein
MGEIGWYLSFGLLAASVIGLVLSIRARSAFTASLAPGTSFPPNQAPDNNYTIAEPGDEDAPTDDGNIASEDHATLTDPNDSVDDLTSVANLTNEDFGVHPSNDPSIFMMSEKLAEAGKVLRERGSLLIVGPSYSGKSRLAAEVVRSEFPLSRAFRPSVIQQLYRLTSEEASRTPTVVLIDVGLLRHLDETELSSILRRHIVVVTARSNEYESLMDRGHIKINEHFAVLFLSGRVTPAKARLLDPLVVYETKGRYRDPVQESVIRMWDKHSRSYEGELQRFHVSYKLFSTLAIEDRLRDWQHDAVGLRKLADWESERVRSLASFRLGVLQATRGDYRQAELAWRQVIQAEAPGLAPFAAYNLGQMFAAIGQMDHAREAWLILLTIGPELADEAREILRGMGYQPDLQ